jgi:multiple sugar transport system permease protein
MEAAPRPRYAQSPSVIAHLGRVGLYALIVVLSILFIIPLVWTIINSTRPPFASVGLLPSQIGASSYRLALTLVPYGSDLLHSVIIAGITVGLGTFSSALVGFAFARLRAPGSRALFVVILSTMMLPSIVWQIPLYIIFKQVGLIDNYLPWVLWGIQGNPFFIFLYRQFFMNVPTDLEDAARVDGCTTFGIWWRIFLPVSIPIIATVAIMSFQFSWGDYLTPYIFLQDNLWPLATELTTNPFHPTNNAGLILNPVVDAGVTLFILPVIIVFFIGQRYLMEGVVMTGLKA